ncbi:MAG: sensor histidine kinase [Planctomycetota bacterium]|jgi:signal transduction histidine kinase
MGRVTRYQILSGVVLLAVGACAGALTLEVPGAQGLLVVTVAVLAAGVAHFLAVGWLLRRWRRLVAELGRKLDLVQKGDLSEEIPEEWGEEFGDLAPRFHAMLGGVRAARRQSLELARKQANIEKFAALGRLSAGVAHEINNPVGGILTCLETMKGLEPGSDRFQEYLSLVKSGLERIGKIVRQLLRFSRQQPAGERQEVDLNAIIEEVTVLSLFHNQKGDVEVIRRSGKLPPVDGVPDLLNQVFLNIVLNALQAMPRGGTLVIQTRAEGDSVYANFEDTGEGIPEENLPRIFEPFFTTKEVGVGTGLGLSVALGIVEAHGGSIEVGLAPGGGSRFSVRLPVAATRSPNVSPVLEESS